MEKTISLKDRSREITVSDFDNDDEIEIVITNDESDDNYFWLNKETVISLKKHLDYLASKI